MSSIPRSPGRGSWRFPAFGDFCGVRGVEFVGARIWRALVVLDNLCLLVF